MEQIASQPAPIQLSDLKQVFFDQDSQTVLDLVNPFNSLSVYSRETQNEIAVSNKCTVVIMDLAQAYKLQEQKHIKPVSITTSAFFNEMLEVMPPSNWHRKSDFEHFHLSERISGNIVRYLVRAGDKYYYFQNDAGMTTTEIRAHIDQAILAGLQ